VVLHGLGKKIKCKLLTKDSPRKSSKIGREWKEFYSFHGSKEGNIIVFEAHKEINNQQENQSYCYFVNILFI